MKGRHYEVNNMKTHKVIEAIDVLTLNQLQALSISKGEAFANYPHTFDYAVPQPWLNDFAEWCKLNTLNLVGGLGLNWYNLILSTTVWGYEKNDNHCLRWVGPVTCCKEVYQAYRKYEKTLV